MSLQHTNPKKQFVVFGLLSFPKSEEWAVLSHFLCKKKTFHPYLLRIFQLRNRNKWRFLSMGRSLSLQISVLLAIFLFVCFHFERTANVPQLPSSCFEYWGR